MAQRDRIFQEDVGPQTRSYRSYQELQSRLYLSRTQLFRLDRDGARLLPDVVITPTTLGWSDERILQYGIDTGRLDEHGEPAGGWDGDRPLNRVRDGSLPEMRRLVEQKYSAPPRMYLGSGHCSYVYGHAAPSTFVLRSRGAFIPAAVQVGRAVGWDEQEVIRFGRQSGRLSDPATLVQWAARRTEEFGLDPNADWVRELLGDFVPAAPLSPPKADKHGASHTPIPWAIRRTTEFGLDPDVPWVVDILGRKNLPEIPSHLAASG